MRTTGRLRLALVAAAQVALLAAPHDALSRPAPHDPTIVVEAESAAGRRRRDGGRGGRRRAGRSCTSPARRSARRRAACGWPATGCCATARRSCRSASRWWPWSTRPGRARRPMPPGGSTSGPWRRPSAWGANTIRFQLSQRGLDPLDLLYSQGYVDRITAGVALARAHGLVVILSIQDQGPSGGTSHAQPSEATIRDWQTLTAPLQRRSRTSSTRSSTSPRTGPTPDGWAVWRDGGPPGTQPGNTGRRPPARPGGHPGHRGHERRDRRRRPVRPATRRRPAAPRPAGPGRLRGPPLSDPLLREPEDWEPGFGFLSTQYPVVATEWTAVSRVRFCKPEWATTAPLLLDYLQSRDIGMLGWALDVIDTPDRRLAVPTDEPRLLPVRQEFSHGAGELLKAEMPGWAAARRSPARPGSPTRGSSPCAVDVPEARDVPPLEPRETASRETEPGSADPGRRRLSRPGLGSSDPGRATGRGSRAWRPPESEAGRHTIRFLGADGRRQPRPPRPHHRRGLRPGPAPATTARHRGTGVSPVDLAASRPAAPAVANFRRRTDLPTGKTTPCPTAITATSTSRSPSPASSGSSSTPRAG